MKTIRNIACLCLTCMILLGLTACGGAGGADSSAGEAAYTATVKIISTDDTLLDSQVSLSETESTCKDALVKACQAKKLAYVDNNGLFDGFGGIASTQEDGWLFYFNGVLADKGLGDTPLVAGGDNTIEMRYVNYNEAFGS